MITRSLVTGKIINLSDSVSKQLVKDRKKPVLINTIKFNKQVLKDVNQLNELQLFN